MGFRFRTSDYLYGKSRITSRLLFKRKLMRFENLKDSSLLKPGELLVVPKYCKLYGDSALLHLREDAESGRLQFYRNRQEPVPWITRAKHGRIFRRPRTTNERRAYFGSKVTKENLQSYGVALKLRQKRKWHVLPNAYHDLSSAIKEAGKSIVEHSERAQAASTVESTALPSGFREARRGLSRETNRLHGSHCTTCERSTRQARSREIIGFSRGDLL